MAFGEINATIGIDLGQKRDHTALVTVERLERFYGPTDEHSLDDNVHGLESVYVVRRAALCPLGTPYPVIVNQTAELLYRPELREARAVFDGSGVGVGVADMFKERYRRDRRIRHRPISLTITSGTTSRGWNVSKFNLISNLIRITQENRLFIPDDLELADKLRQEMRDFTLKYSKAGNVQFEADKESSHDDLVMALSYAVWKDHRHVTPWGLLPDGTTVDRYYEDA